LDGEPFAQLNVMPTQHKFWRNDKTMEFSKLSQFGLTCAVLTEDRGEALLTWYLGASHAKTLAQQEKAQELKAQEAECGKKWHGLLAKYDPNTHSWKTAQCSLLEDLEQSLQTWPRWGSMRNGASYHAQMQVEFIYENAPGLSLPKPTVNMVSGGANHNSPSVIAGKHGINLKGALSIPRTGANEGKGSGKDRFIGSPGFRGAKMSEGLRTCETDPIYLNPLFAELVMMWPMGWTDLKPLEMDKFLEWQQQHSSCLESV
jgi:hypothetical protein